jgi:D-alanyl-D-alanine-carboxypeptidase/D-alanyl-D-alanine-endopeptidase
MVATGLGSREKFIRRKSKNILAGLACLAALLSVGPVATVVAAPIPDAEISTYLEEYIDRDDQGVGIVVGVVDARGPRIFSYGKTKDKGTNDVNADTLFEIGSITKIFTTLMLQNMVDRGELKLEDPIGKFLPASVKTPSRNGKQITLLDLATHTSGLPRLPDAVSSVWNMLLHSDDPYAHFGEKELYEFVSTYQPERDIGAKFEYSNVGMELLGHCLALKAGTNYESLMLQRICGPLNMTNTFIKVPPALQSHFATGHDNEGKPVKNWSSPLPGDGGIRSTANDLLKFLSAEMGLTKSSLSGSMAKTQIPRRPTDEAHLKIGLGWLIVTNGVIWHNGGTAGFCSWIGFDPKTHYGIIVLCNCAGDPDVPGETIVGLRPYRRVAKIDPQLYNHFAGKYKGVDVLHGTLFVTRKEEQLFSHYEDQGEFELYPESTNRFFNNEYDIQVTFQTDTNGNVSGIAFQQEGAKSRFKKEK